MKEKLCFVDVTKSHSSLDDAESYELPDGQVIFVRSARFRTVEAMFEPRLEVITVIPI